MYKKNRFYLKLNLFDLILFYYRMWFLGRPVIDFKIFFALGCCFSLKNFKLNNKIQVCNFSRTKISYKLDLVPYLYKSFGKTYIDNEML